MRNGDAGNQAGMPGYSSGGSGRNPQGPVAGASNPTARKEDSRQKTQKLMEAVVERENMLNAPHRVETNKDVQGWTESPFKPLELFFANTGRASEKNCWKADISLNPCSRWRYLSRVERECDNWAFPLWWTGSYSSTIWIRSWRKGSMRFAGTQMTAIFT